MVTRQQRHQPDFARRVAGQSAAADDVSRMVVVVVVVDVVADVVQDAGRPEQLAVDWVQPVRRLQLIEKPQAQSRHVFAVDDVVLEVARQVENAELAQVRENGMRLAGQKALVENALAQPLLADGDAVEAAVVQQRRIGQRAALNDVGAIGVQAGQLAALFLAHTPEPAGHFLNAAGCQLVAVDHVQREAKAGLLDAGQVAHGTAQRHQPVAGPRSEPFYRLQMLLQEVV